MKPTPRRATTDALAIIWKEFYEHDPKRRDGLERKRVDMAIGEAVHELRKRAGLTQKQLATRIGTTHSVISRLEDVEYRGHSLRMLHRICAALDHRLELRLVPLAGSVGGAPRPRRRAAR
jgi:ribosome-binding protein aMBF1 (putative translation factor)